MSTYIFPAFAVLPGLCAVPEPSMLAVALAACCAIAKWRKQVCR